VTERMTAAEYRSAKPKGRPQRVVGAIRTKAHGFTFDSRKEARRYGELLILEAAGEIHSLRRQVKFELRGALDYILTPTGRKMRYVADFHYWDVAAFKWVVEDVKSGKHRTEVYQIKRAILAAQGVEIREV